MSVEKISHKTQINDNLIEILEKLSENTDHYAGLGVSFQIKFLLKLHLSINYNIMNVED